MNNNKHHLGCRNVLVSEYPITNIGQLRLDYGMLLKDFPKKLVTFVIFRYGINTLSRNFRGDYTDTCDRIDFGVYRLKYKMKIQNTKPRLK